MGVILQWNVKPKHLTTVADDNRCAVVLSTCLLYNPVSSDFAHPTLKPPCVTCWVNPSDSFGVQAALWMQHQRIPAASLPSGSESSSGLTKRLLALDLSATEVAAFVILTSHPSELFFHPICAAAPGPSNTERLWGREQVAGSVCVCVCVLYGSQVNNLVVQCLFTSKGGNVSVLISLTSSFCLQRWADGNQCDGCSPLTPEM